MTRKGLICRKTKQPTKQPALELINKQKKKICRQEDFAVPADH